MKRLDVFAANQSGGQAAGSDVLTDLISTVFHSRRPGGSRWLWKLREELATCTRRAQRLARATFLENNPQTGLNWLQSECYARLHLNEMRVAACVWRGGGAGCLECDVKSFYRKVTERSRRRPAELGLVLRTLTGRTRIPKLVLAVLLLLLTEPLR